MISVPFITTVKLVCFSFINILWIGHFCWLLFLFRAVVLNVPGSNLPFSARTDLNPPLCVILNYRPERIFTTKHSLKKFLVNSSPGIHLPPDKSFLFRTTVTARFTARLSGPANRSDWPRPLLLIATVIVWPAMQGAGPYAGGVCWKALQLFLIFFFFQLHSGR